MESIESYLISLIQTKPSESLSEEETQYIAKEGIEKFILSRLVHKRFRHSAPPEELRVNLQKKIHNSITLDKPIHICVTFGGYKKWQLPTYPNPDWSEVFNIVQLREYLAPIAAAYQPGVCLEYYSDEIIVPRLDQYPQEDVDSYTHQFQSLIAWFQDYLPARFTLKFSKVGDSIPYDEFWRRIENELPALREKWDALPVDEQELRLKKSERNHKGDMSTMSADEKQEMLIESNLLHDAFAIGNWDEGATWGFGDLDIAVGFVSTGNWGIRLKSTRSSANQFWVGIGALKQRGEEYIPTSLTYDQYVKVESQLMQEPVSVFPEEFINLKSIPVLNESSL